MKKNVFHSCFKGHDNDHTQTHSVSAAPKPSCRHSKHVFGHSYLWFRYVHHPEYQYPPFRLHHHLFTVISEIWNTFTSTLSFNSALDNTKTCLLVDLMWIYPLEANTQWSPKLLSNWQIIMQITLALISNIFLINLIFCYNPSIYLKTKG